jgi:hypothetical protein
MPEVLVEYNDIVTAEDGTRYLARACGGPADNNGIWHGWLEFINADTGKAVRSGRETTQPNRTDTVYWATGLTPVYLEGALHRALHPLVKAPTRPVPAPAFDGPAPNMVDEPPVTDSILNPFSVYRKGEALLRAQLAALSVWHLVNIIRDHALSDQPAVRLNGMRAGDLVDLIVTAVRRRVEEPITR